MPESAAERWERFTPIATGEDYLRSIRARGTTLYLLGERIAEPADHPIIKPSINALKATYDLAVTDPELATAYSPLIDARVNRFLHIPASPADLLAKHALQRRLGQLTGTCFQRCTGLDALSALHSITFDLGAPYHERYLEFLTRAQRANVLIAAGMTDPKGDRSKPPHQQADPEVFLRVTCRNEHGLFLRGAKAHMTGGWNMHWICVLPTLNLRPEDRDYAVIAFVPSDAEGLTYFYGRQASDTRALEPGTIDQGNACFGGQEVLVHFDDVFVPWEHVLLDGQTEIAQTLVSRFTAYHRASYVCKTGLGDVLTGAAAEIAAQNGVAAAAHVRDKLAEMVHLNETIYSSSIASATQAAELESGAWINDELLANVCKHNVTRFPYELARLAQDLAGGLVATMPSEADLRSEEIGPLLERLLAGRADVATEDRMRILRLIENLTLGRNAVGYLTESLHGAGSPQGQRIQILRRAGLEHKRGLARRLAGIRPLALDAQTLCEAFQRTARAYADAPALRRPNDAVPMTWGEYAAQVERLAGALAALGVRRGDTVAMLLANRPEALVLDAACIHLGAVPFNLYTTSSPEQLEYLIGHAGARFALAEDALVSRLPPIEHLFTVEAFDELLARPAPSGFDFEAEWRAAESDDQVTLIYTSGTTGPPKGVEITHANVLGTLRGYHQVVPYTAGGRLMSYLPLAHLADRMSAHYAALATGACVTVVTDPRRAGEALRDVRPTTWVGMPRVWEKLKTAVETHMDGLEPDAIVAALGLDEARCLYSGGAPIAPEVLQFFVDLGLPILEIWGQTETSAAGTANRPGAMRVGTVGTPLPGTEVRLAADGELLFRGPGAMRRYRNDPVKTAETIDPDGWIRTGDVGERDADGYIRIVDRKKELIIDAMGKNMSPANIENALKAACPLIGTAVAIGDRRPYVTALLVLDPDAAGEFARAHGIAFDSPTELAADPRVIAAVADGVRRAGERLSRVEQIKRFELLGEEWAPGGDELTPTMKLKRKPIAEKYEAVIEALYA